MDKAVQEEPEEGEIIDDFEVISDYSIPSSPVSGKSVPHRDLLRVVSLSSISDSESDAFRASVSRAVVRPPRQKRKRKRSPHRKRRRSGRYDSDTSDSDFNATLQKQLKRAVRINSDSADANHNSLQTRLQAMLVKTGDDRQDDDDELKVLREVALLSSAKDKNGEEGESANQNDVKPVDEDEELFRLRLDALKSAMIKKAAERKKRKENKENDANKDNKDVGISEETKETTSASVKHENPVQNSNNNSIDEDVDIMRAMLLVSMSNKVIPKDAKTSTPLVSVPKKILPKKPIYIKPIKKLIINLKDSDDSDFDEPKPKMDADTKTNKIDEFLKTQRAAVERQNEKDTSDLMLDKSVVKLLPKSQQREYQMLKQKLLMARRKKLRKTSVKVTNKVTNAPVQSARNNGQKQGSQMIFRKTLEDMQVKKSGRLQMKGKYKALAPLLQKVNHANIERQQCELTIKRLLAELQRAKDKLHISHQNYVGLATKLSKAKSAIDRGASIKKNGPTDVAEEKKTSTPVRDVAPRISCEFSSINAEEKDKKEEEVMKCEDAKKYVSPLDTRNSQQVNDPLTMYCPFELFGVCKDPECHFNHCSKTFHVKKKSA